MTSQMIANSIIVVGFFSAVAFLFTAAAATALAGSRSIYGLKS